MDEQDPAAGSEPWRSVYSPAQPPAAQPNQPTDPMQGVPLFGNPVASQSGPQPAPKATFTSSTPQQPPQSPVPVETPALNFDDPLVRFQLRGIAGSAASAKASILDRKKNKRYFVGHDDRVEQYRVRLIDMHDQVVKLSDPDGRWITLEKAD